MPDSEFVRLTTISDAHYAHLARAWLADQGMDCRLDSDVAATQMSAYGAVTRSVQVYVRRQDLDQAMALLQQQEDDLRGRRAEPEQALFDWICPECQEQSPFTFDHCWSCGLAQPQSVERILRGDAPPTLSADELPPTGAEQANSPYSPPRYQSVGPVLQTDEELARRAWLSAVFSIMVPPLAFYSVILAARCYGRKLTSWQVHLAMMSGLAIILFLTIWMLRG